MRFIGNDGLSRDLVGSGQSGFTTTALKSIVNELNGYDIEDLHPGMTASFSKTITEADVTLFAGVSGDHNAIHVDQEFAATTVFQGRVAHGLLTASLISATLANKLPGPGSVYVNQHLRFLAPVRPGDTVKATVTVLAIDEKLAQVYFSTTCRVGTTVVLDGQATVKATSLVRRLSSEQGRTPNKAAPAATTKQ